MEQHDVPQYVEARLPELQGQRFSPAEARSIVGAEVNYLLNDGNIAAVAAIQFADGRPPELVPVPDHVQGPRMAHGLWLALVKFEGDWIAFGYVGGSGEADYVSVIHMNSLEFVLADAPVLNSGGGPITFGPYQVQRLQANTT